MYAQGIENNAYQKQQQGEYTIRRPWFDDGPGSFHLSSSIYGKKIKQLRLEFVCFRHLLFLSWQRWVHGCLSLSHTATHSHIKPSFMSTRKPLWIPSRLGQEIKYNVRGSENHQYGKTASACFAVLRLYLLSFACNFSHAIFTLRHTLFLKCHISLNSWWILLQF